MSVSRASLEASPLRAAAHGVRPLCVGLDGTLVVSDLLLESLVLLVKRRPFCAFLIPVWRLRGRGVLNAEVAARVTVNPDVLPYDRELIRWLETERGAGRRLWLCTAANEPIAARVASHIGLFEGVFAGDRDGNPTGQTSVARLIERFGDRGFDYCGNEWRDIGIWRRAHGAIIVHGSRRLEQEARRHTPVLRIFPPRTNAWRAIVRALRPHQYAKNVLILVPLLAAHRAGELAACATSLLAVVTFCVCASSVYVVNDLTDLEVDRAHAHKSKRPFAAGDLSLLAGLLLAPGLLAAAFVMAAFLPRNFQFVLATYYALTLAYSFALKKLMLIDAVVLAGLYTLRIVAGVAAVGVPLSFWMLLFSVLLFLSLAFVKRFAELDALRRQQRSWAAGRGYNADDLPILRSLGCAAGYLSVLVLAFYINSPEIEALYRRPKLIWMLCVLMLYWISRVWMTTQRGAMEADPVAFALKDRVSLAVGVLAAITVAVAI